MSKRQKRIDKLRDSTRRLEKALKDSIDITITTKLSFDEFKLCKLWLNQLPDVSHPDTKLKLAGYLYLEKYFIIKLSDSLAKNWGGRWQLMSDTRGTPVTTSWDFNRIEEELYTNQYLKDIEA